jgi:hypothetical protein
MLPCGERFEFWLFVVSMDELEIPELHSSPTTLLFPQFDTPPAASEPARFVGLGSTLPVLKYFYYNMILLFNREFMTIILF